MIMKTQKGEYKTYGEYWNGYSKIEKIIIISLIVIMFTISVFVANVGDAAEEYARCCI